MPPFDLALAIELYGAVDYRGGTHHNTEAQFNALVWLDPMPRPTWQQLQDIWASGAWIVYFPDWVDPDAPVEPEPEEPVQE